MNRFKILWLILIGKCRIVVNNCDLEFERDAIMLAINCKLITVEKTFHVNSIAEACKTAKAGDTIAVHGGTTQPVDDEEVKGESSSLLHQLKSVTVEKVLASEAMPIATLVNQCHRAGREITRLHNQNREQAAEIERLKKSAAMKTVSIYG